MNQKIKNENKTLFLEEKINKITTISKDNDNDSDNSSHQYENTLTTNNNFFHIQSQSYNRYSNHAYTHAQTNIVHKPNNIMS